MTRVACLELVASQRSKQCRPFGGRAGRGVLRERHAGESCKVAWRVGANRTDERRKQRRVHRHELHRVLCLERKSPAEERKRMTPNE